LKDLDYSAFAERYRDLSDEELLRLYERRSDLLPAAQLALDHAIAGHRLKIKAERRILIKEEEASDLLNERRREQSLLCQKDVPRATIRILKSFVLAMLSASAAAIVGVAISVPIFLSPMIFDQSMLYGYYTAFPAMALGGFAAVTVFLYLLRRFKTFESNIPSHARPIQWNKVLIVILAAVTTWSLLGRPLLGACLEILSRGAFL
jgi:hypothetical protein